MVLDRAARIAGLICTDDADDLQARGIIRNGPVDTTRFSLYMATFL